MGLSLKSNYEKKFVSSFEIGEVPRSPGKWNRNWLYFLPFIFNFEQGDLSQRTSEPAYYIVNCRISYVHSMMVEKTFAWLSASSNSQDHWKQEGQRRPPPPSEISQNKIKPFSLSSPPPISHTFLRP